jgi:hypothetical protein
VLQFAEQRVVVGDQLEIDRDSLLHAGPRRSAPPPRCGCRGR